MALPQDDRLAFSLKIANSDEEVKVFRDSQSLVSKELEKALKLDTGNKNLFEGTNILINAYHVEYGDLTGSSRYGITEQDIIDSSNRKVRNHFFPNDTSTAVPSLSGSNNIWIKTQPFALTYAIGKDYTETYGSTAFELGKINAIITLIDSAGLYTDIQNTTGKSCEASGTCSLPSFTTEATCVSNGGIWTPGPDQISNYAPIQTLKSNLVTAINDLKTFALAEVGHVPTDLNNQAINQAAKDNINNALIPSLDTWLSYSDFQDAPVSTCVAFNSYDASLLAPTKLNSTQLASLKTDLQNRITFIGTRVGQLNTILGTIVQDINTGVISSSTGLYGKRFGILLLRIDTLGGSLSTYSGLLSALDAQNGFIASILNAKSTYMSLIPTSSFIAAASNTEIISIQDASHYSVGDVVYVAAENQEELKFAVRSKSGNTITLNDKVPAKYRPNEKARIYKDIS